MADPRNWWLRISMVTTAIVGHVQLGGTTGFERPADLQCAVTMHHTAPLCFLMPLNHECR